MSNKCLKTTVLLVFASFNLAKADAVLPQVIDNPSYMKLLWATSLLALTSIASLIYWKYKSPKWAKPVSIILIVCTLIALGSLLNTSKTTEDNTYHKPKKTFVH